MEAGSKAWSPWQDGVIKEIYGRLTVTNRGGILFHECKCGKNWYSHFIDTSRCGCSRQKQKPQSIVDDRNSLGTLRPDFDSIANSSELCDLRALSDLP